MAVPTTLIDQLKLLTGAVSAEEDLLSMLLSIAAQKVLDRAYPFDPLMFEVPTRYLLTQLQIAVFLYNKQGAEGQTAHNENGINRTYEGGDVPESLMQGIVPFVGTF